MTRPPWSSPTKRVQALRLAAAGLCAAASACASSGVPEPEVVFAGATVAGRPIVCYVRAFARPALGAPARVLVCGSSAHNRWAVPLPPECSGGLFPVLTRSLGAVGALVSAFECEQRGGGQPSYREFVIEPSGEALRATAVPLDQAGDREFREQSEWPIRVQGAQQGRLGLVLHSGNAAVYRPFAGPEVVLGVWGDLGPFPGSESNIDSVSVWIRGSEPIVSEYALTSSGATFVRSAIIIGVPVAVSSATNSAGLALTRAPDHSLRWEPAGAVVESQGPDGEVRCSYAASGGAWLVSESSTGNTIALVSTAGSLEVWMLPGEAGTLGLVRCELRPADGGLQGILWGMKPGGGSVVGSVSVLQGGPPRFELIEEASEGD